MADQKALAREAQEQEFACRKEAAAGVPDEVRKLAGDVDAGLENVANDYAIPLSARRAANRARDLIRALLGK